jgi:hypothetical protein
MKIVVIGGTGLIGSKLIALLTAQGHTAVAAAPPQPRSAPSSPSPLAERCGKDCSVCYELHYRETAERRFAMHAMLKSTLVPLLTGLLLSSAHRFSPYGKSFRQMFVRMAGEVDRFE